MSENTPSLVRAVVRGAGLGALAGGLEAVGLAASSELPLGLVGFAGLGLTCVATMALVSGMVAVPLHLGVKAVARDDNDVSRGALELAVLGMLLCGWYLWAAAMTLLAQDRLPAAVLFAVLPLPFGFIVRFNATYWLKRARSGATSLQLGPVSLAIALVLVLVAAGVHAARNTGGGGALAGDPSVVLVTVADVAPGSVDWPEESLVFSDVITPTSSVRGAAASLLTGLHPLRTEVVRDDQALDRGHRTLAEVFAEEGYATAAFVADPALREDSGLAEGFLTFDDRAGALGGLARASLLDRLGLDEGERSADDVAASFGDWLGAHGEVPHFAWVQLPAEGSAAAVQQLADLVADSSTAEETLFVVAGLTRSHQVGVSDGEVRVPMRFSAPGVEMSKREITSQVRLFDLAPTALSYAQLDDLPVTEGIGLLDYGTGRRSAALPVVVLAEGRIGLRSGGVAYEQDLDGGSQRLFDLDRDPTVDVSADQPEALERARGMLSPEVIAYRGILEMP